MKQLIISTMILVAATMAASAATPAASTHHPAPGPVIDAGLPALAIGIGYGIYWLMTRRP